MRVVGIFPLILFFFYSTFLSAQNKRYAQIVSFVEWGGSMHAGKYMPMWQVSNAHGLSSLDNSTYLRTSFSYFDSIAACKVNTKLDLVMGVGFTSLLTIHQAYVDLSYKWIELMIGSKEFNSPLLNQELSSGGLTWSGNSRPIPQVKVGVLDYVQILPKLAFRAELSYGWFTDNNFQREHVGERFSYTRDIKYHHKAAFLRIGKPKGKWILDLGMSLDTQFGGVKVGGVDAGNLGNGLIDYLHALIPMPGNKEKPLGEQVAFQGNFLGSEHARLTYRHKKFDLSVYMENFYDDFSGMGKFNGWDGLWGIEYKKKDNQLISGLVLEYFQSTNQSGPMHGLDDSEVKKTGGADDYYNNDWYPGWVHWGMSIGTPLIVSPIYNEDGDLSFKYNRVRAFHLGWSGVVGEVWRYVAKLSFSRIWGTPFKPSSYILENFSTFASLYYSPKRWRNSWLFNTSIAYDMGDVYGDNLGFKFKIRRIF